MTQRYVAADPYPWPFDGDLRPENTALIVIDMQTDFCGIGGYVDRMGYDLSLTRAPIGPIAAVLDQMRRLRFHIFHTGRDIAPILPIFRRINAGGHDVSARASVTRGLAAASWCVASRAGRLFRS